VSLHAIRQLGQFLLRKLNEVRRGPVRLKRRIVLVLLVNEEATRLGLVAMYLVHLAAGLVARLLG